MFTALLPAAGNQDQTGTLGATLVAGSAPMFVWSWRSSCLAEPAASDLGMSIRCAGWEAIETAIPTGAVDKTGDEIRTREAKHHVIQDRTPRLCRHVRAHDGRSRAAR